MSLSEMVAVNLCVYEISFQNIKKQMFIFGLWFLSDLVAVWFFNLSKLHCVAHHFIALSTQNHI